MGLFDKLRGHSQWPTALASLDEIAFDPEGGTRVDVSGNYKVDGEYYSVMFGRDFNSTEAAAAWARIFEQSPTVTVRYNPDKPAEYEIENLPGS